LGASLDVAVGLIALLLVAPQVRAWSAVEAAVTRERAAAAAAQVTTHAPLGAVLLLYAVVGFTALLYEVAWTRALAVALGSSISAFSSMLGAFLMGIALGSLLFRRWIDRTRAPHLLLAGGVIALAALGLATSIAMPHLPDVFLAYFASPDRS